MRLHGLSTTMARKSLTLVQVGPGRDQVAEPARKTRWNCCRQEKRPDRGRAPAPARACRRRRRRRPGRRREPRAAVGAVGVGGERRDARRAVERDGQRQRVFLVRPAAALAADGDGQFAAGQDHGAAALPPAASRASRRARPRPRAPRPRSGRRGRRTRSRPPRTAASAARKASAGRAISLNSVAGERRVAGLRAFRWRDRPSARVDRVGQVELDSARRWRARRRASVGSGTVGPEPITAGSSPGTSEIASVTTRAGCARARQPAALDAREMLAHRVDLADVGARAQQRPRHRLLVGERESGGRRDPVRRCAARQQHQHQIVRVRAIGERERAARRLQARRRRGPDGRPRSSE